MATALEEAIKDRVESLLAVMRPSSQRDMARKIFTRLQVEGWSTMTPQEAFFLGSLQGRYMQ
jgi:hypothetical protein